MYVKILYIICGIFITWIITFNIAEITKKTEEIDDSECSVNLNNETTNKKKNTINGNKYLNPIYFKHQ